MILFGPLTSWLNRIPTAILFAYLTIFLPCPFLRLPQRVIQLLMPLHCSQPAYLVDSIGGFLQFFWLSHIKLLRIVFDGGIYTSAFTAQEEAARLSGFDYKYFQRIEYGQKNLSLTSLAKLAKALKVTIAEIVTVDS